MFDKFRDAGMDPIDHVLTDREWEVFQHSFSLLPSSYQKVLRQHLHSFSFMDHMPNTALTSPVDTTLQEKKFNITFRAGIFDETISEWATWKENMCYVPSEINEYQIRIEAGEMNAMVYVLLHEATHIMDVVMEISPQGEKRNSLVANTPLTKDIWHKRNVPVEAYTDSLLETTRFRSGKPIPIAQAFEVYSTLKKTPFVSLYGMASWNEDLAELATLYHLTEKMNQPYMILVIKNGKEKFRFEPMKNELVKKRTEQLEMFYDMKPE
ncbi:hypothetical protein [Sinomicrobium sp. M5D2P9]